MKLILKTKHIELEYADDYSMLEAQAKDRIESLIKTMYEYEAKASPMAIHHAPVIGTVEEIFCNKTK
jgi:hypothetical protein